MNCHWCNIKFECGSWPTTNQRFCSKKCKYAHWRARNREKLQQVSRDWTVNNPERSRAIKRKYNNEHPEKQREYYQRNKQEIDIHHLITYREQTRSRQQAKRIANKLGMIKECSINDDCNGRIELHHIDHNPFNNDPANFIYLCRKHHMQDHRK